MLVRTFWYKEQKKRYAEYKTWTRICKKGKNSMLKIKFENPMTNLLASKWISAEYIADF